MVFLGLWGENESAKTASGGAYYAPFQLAACFIEAGG